MAINFDQYLMLYQLNIQNVLHYLMNLYRLKN